MHLVLACRAGATLVKCEHRLYRLRNLYAIYGASKDESHNCVGGGFVCTLRTPPGTGLKTQT